MDRKQIRFEGRGFYAPGSENKNEFSYSTNSAKLFTNWEAFIFCSMRFVVGILFV
jgi:hypothetical protein